MGNVVLPLLFLVIICLVKLCTPATMGPTLARNQSLADGDALISGGQNFALGFFSPGNTTRRYLGVWYNKVSKLTVVWVANRNSPLNDSSGVLSFDASGSLLILTAGSSAKNTTPLWSTNVSAAAGGGSNAVGSVSARLLDTGNLEIIQQPSQRVVWQSFDYPTDTMMPFMKLGLDRKTGLNRFLTSWKGPDDPGTGSYTYRMDPTGVPQVFMKGPARWWRTGPWNGVRWSGVPEMTNRFIFNASYVDDRDELSVWYGIRDLSIFSRMVVAESGSVERFTWHESERRWIGFWSVPKDTCDNFGLCGAYSFCDPNRDPGQFECKCLPGYVPRSPKDWYLRDGSGGCVRERANSMCGNGEGFVTVKRVKVPDTGVARVDMGASGDACRQLCLRNCSCVAFTSANVSGAGSGCLGWFGGLVDIKVYPNDGQDLYLRADAVEVANERKRSGGGGGFRGAKRTLVLAFLGVFLVGLLLVSASYWWYRRHLRLAGRARMRSLLELRSGNTLDNEYGDGNDGDESNKKINLPFFSLSEIKSATDNFSNKLGEGGFGPVYKGRFGVNGPEIAVKRLSKSSGQGAEEFKNEIQLIANLQHRNLVKILGCCIQNEETMLIYEYMTNKSLDTFIFDSTRKAILNWRMRYEIIIGIARGILYLHQDSRLRIIHRDLKASNILLDGEMTPKISDFGMARIFGGNQTQANTNRVVGTFGYMSPEYALDGLFSMKSDVFSFGVLILEIVCGKKNLALYNDDPLSNLIRHVWELWTEGRALEMVDASMGDLWEDFEVIRCIQVGLLCVQESPMDRPNMSTVVFMLSNHQTALAPPKQPAFSVRKSSRNPRSWSGTGSTSCSTNEMTMTAVEPR